MHAELVAFGFVCAGAYIYIRIEGRMMNGKKQRLISWGRVNVEGTNGEAERTKDTFLEPNTEKTRK